jgi:hypothetical protein
MATWDEILERNTYYCNLSNKFIDVLTPPFQKIRRNFSYASTIHIRVRFSTTNSHFPHLYVYYFSFTPILHHIKSPTLFNPVSCIDFRVSVEEFLGIMD